MPFDLNNAEATYQRAMNYMFRDYIGDFIEVYIDDIVIKSSSFEAHLIHLRRMFESIHRH